MKHRIQKLLAAAGIDSRRHVEEMVRQGRVAINGVTRTRLPILVDPETDEVTVDGERVRLQDVLGRVTTDGRRRKAAGLYYLMLNKPRGVVTTNVAQGVQKRAIDLLPPNFPGRVFPVGRLDADSRGLLLLTNDGELTHLLTHPRFGVPKTYRATVDAYILPEHMSLLEKGLYLIDKETGKPHKTARAVLKIQSRTRARTVLDITIKEGRNRQIRRMLARLGYKVRDLNRIRFGPLTLEGLPVGAVRPLTPDEVKAVRTAAERSKAFFERAATGSGKRNRRTGRPAVDREVPEDVRRASPSVMPADDTLDFVPDDTLDD
ncbi:MAG: pseudouridine synthase [Tepidisphaerales bacterium]